MRTDFPPRQRRATSRIDPARGPAVVAAALALLIGCGFVRVAEATGATLLPFLLGGVAGVPEAQTKRLRSQTIGWAP